MTSEWPRGGRRLMNALRKQRGVSVASIASKCGFSPSTYYARLGDAKDFEPVWEAFVVSEKQERPNRGELPLLSE